LHLHAAADLAAGRIDHLNRDDPFIESGTGQGDSVGGEIESEGPFLRRNCGFFPSPGKTVRVLARPGIMG
jgi:hypothetical protein